MEHIIFSVLIECVELIEPVAWYCFLTKVATEKKKMRTMLWSLVLLIMLCLGNNLLEGYFSESPVGSVVTNYSYLVILFCYAVRYFHIPRKTVICYLTFSMITSTWADFFLSYILVKVLRIDASNVLVATGYRLFGVFIMNAIAILVFYFLYRLKRRYGELVNHKYVFYLVVFGLLEDFFIVMIFNFLPSISWKSVNNFNFITILFLCLEFILLVISLCLSIAYGRNEKEYQRIIAFTDTQFKVLHDIQSQIDEANKKYHDIGNHLDTIALLLENNMLIELKEFMNELVPNINKAEIPNVSDSFLLLILYEKEAKANKYQISLRCEIDVKEISIPLLDLNSIVTNLLDNAIEACEKIRNKMERHILFRTYIHEERVFIECSNPYVVKPRILDSGVFETTKKDKVSHGKGLILIQELAHKYGGSMDIRLLENTFLIRVAFNQKYAMKREIEQ